MASKRPLLSSTIRDNQIQNKFTKLDLCLVCGDKASIMNYGALSCSSCKTFFRRNGFNPKDVPVCCYNGQCSITVETRKLCTACRFAKCLTIGMSPELIRKEDLHEKYRSMYKSKRKFLLKKPISLPQPYSLNLLSADQSSLTTENWRLLSNVVHAFDTYSSVPHTEQTVNFISINSKNNPPNIDDSLNMMATIYTSLQSFVNCTTDFRVMTIAEQCSLLQRNMHGLLAFYCVFVFRESGVFNDSSTENAVLPLYGRQNVQSTKRLCMRLDYDVTLVKLMLISLIFSSNCFTITEGNTIGDSLLYGTFRLFGSQNCYAELLWKYITYRYGFWEAALRFDGMIKIALDALKLASNITDSNKIHQHLVEDISEQCENILKLNGSENIPLWGRN